MVEVRNAMDKLVCRLDKVQRIVEIVNKGIKTTIRFFDDGRVGIVNSVIKVA